MILSQFLRLLAQAGVERFRPKNYIRVVHDGGASSEGGFSTATVNSAAYGFTPTGTEVSATYGGLSTGTNAAGAIAIRTGSNAFNAANGELYFQLLDFRFPTQGDGTNSFVMYAGFSDTGAATAPQNGAWFEYDHVTNGNQNWYYCVGAGGVVSKTNTTIAVSTGQKLEVRVKSGVAKFYINNALIAAVSSGLPTGWAQTFGAAIGIRKTAGTSARTLGFDRIEAWQQLATPRDTSQTAF